MKTFKHSGAIGDCLLSLPVVRFYGGGKILLNVNRDQCFFWKHLYGDPTRFLRPLLEEQDYVTSVDVWQGQRPSVDLDEWRDFFADTCYVNTVSILDMHLMKFNVPRNEAKVPWLKAEPIDLGERPVVISRTPRYNNPLFDWGEIVKEHGDRAVFVGFPNEFSAFAQKYGVIEYRRTADLLELAQVIAGCELFIGNQSTPFVIAEAMKKNIILETALHGPNNLYFREGFDARMVYP